MAGPIFGTPRMGRSYSVQDCVYAVISRDNGDVAVARTPKGIVLLGGGVEDGESERDALYREAYENPVIVLRSYRGWASHLSMSITQRRIAIG